MTLGIEPPIITAFNFLLDIRDLYPSMKHFDCAESCSVFTGIAATIPVEMPVPNTEPKVPPINPAEKGLNTDCLSAWFLPCVCSLLHCSDTESLYLTADSSTDGMDNKPSIAFR